MTQYVRFEYGGKIAYGIKTVKRLKSLTGVFLKMRRSPVKS